MAREDVRHNAYEKLIANADDFGLKHYTVDWKTKSLECGALTSVKIMDEDWRRVDTEGLYALKNGQGVEKKTFNEL